MDDPNKGSLKNNNLYNDKELFDDADLNWYDYGYRNYDPQIGRFAQFDPLTDDYPELTPPDWRRVCRESSTSRFVGTRMLYER